MANNTADKTPLNLPAPYVNTFQTLVAGSNIRVAFGEGGPEGQRAYRSAVVMTTGDALELVDQLLAAIKTINPINPPPPSGGGFFGVNLLAENSLSPDLSGLGELGKKPNG